ncbi:MAG TPA: Uma2 family endonuclease [Tepidisphaeraceae bacterium]|nr:Uma2 family endonuclease [Tepidisphaeraceae bacterium]
MSRTVPKITPSISKDSSSGIAILPLQNGDHLTRAEFERRYDAMPNLKKAELIEEVVYMAPRVTISGHASPHLMLSGVVGTYRAATPGIVVADNGSVRLDLDNMPQPDIMAFIPGNQANIDADDYAAGAPDLIAEIAATSASYDLHDKLRVYRRSGVREYIVWRTLDKQFDYFALREGEYCPLSPAADGTFHSEIFPGLWLDTAALLAGDLAKALSHVQQGVASSDHSAFVATLKASH